MDIRNQALKSYQKFQAVSKRISALENKANTLASKNMEALGNNISAISHHSINDKNSFIGTIQDIAKSEISKIKKAENIATKLSQNDEYFLQQHDKIELVAAIHEAEQAINLFVAAKKEIIDAYLKILDTPL